MCLPMMADGGKETYQGHRGLGGIQDKEWLSSIVRGRLPRGTLTKRYEAITFSSICWALVLLASQLEHVMYVEVVVAWAVSVLCIGFKLRIFN